MEDKQKIRFYVAECMEFKSLGIYEENIKTIKEAFDIYNTIPSKRLNGGKGIGFTLYDKDNQDFDFDLFINNEIDEELANMCFGDNKLVHKTIEDLKTLLRKKNFSVN